MSHSDKWPHDVKQVNGARETFTTIVATIDKVFTNFGTGYSFVEDTTVDPQGRKPIWNMSGAFANGKREDYTGVVYDAGDRIEVDLSLNPGRGGKIFYDVKRAAKVGEGTAVTQYETPPPAPAGAPSPLDVKITKGMAFNNLTAALASGQTFFEDEDTLQAARSMWHMAMEDAMAGKTPFSREADVIADAIVVPEQAKAPVAEAPQATSVIDETLNELVETMPWEGESIEDLKQKGVALMTSKWDSPVDAGDELRKALGLPQDWSQMTADQWKEVIAYAEAKD
jgi:hypothetical protein